MKEYGLIGRSIGHSFSQAYFTEKFKALNIEDAAYRLYPLERIEDIHELISSKRNLHGLNVTIPYKEAIIPFLDQLDEKAEAVGAVNTIKIVKGRSRPYLVGYNTDVLGFKTSLEPLLAKEHDAALILGTGGAAKAVAYVLEELSIPYFYVSRLPTNEKQLSYDNLTSEILSTHLLIVNCTPVGTYPNINESPLINFEGIGGKHIIYDLVYNPPETKLIKVLSKKGSTTMNGLKMLELQAEASWRIWNEK